jgi:hypothetical protein
LKIKEAGSKRNNAVVVNIDQASVSIRGLCLHHPYFRKLYNDDMQANFINDPGLPGVVTKKAYTGNL